jgi:hypothetical protein
LEYIVMPSRRGAAVTLSLLLVAPLTAAAVLTGAPPAEAAEGFQPGTEAFRVGGADRFETSAQAAELAYPDGATTAILANGWRAIDALAASHFSWVEQAPILLTERDALPDATLDALDELGVTDVIVLGDENSVSDAGLAELEALGFDVVDVYAGADRYDTAAQLNDAQWQDGEVFIARADVAPGEIAADALAAGPATQGRTMLLTAADDLPPVTAAALEDDRPRYVYFLGRGITDRVKAQVAEVLPDAELVTIGGADRSETSVLLAESGLVNLRRTPTGGSPWPTGTASTR